MVGLMNVLQVRGYLVKVRKSEIGACSMELDEKPPVGEVGRDLTFSPFSLTTSTGQEA
jgi:hypothetical protein